MADEGGSSINASNQLSQLSSFHTHSLTQSSFTGDGPTLPPLRRSTENEIEQVAFLSPKFFELKAASDVFGRGKCWQVGRGLIVRAVQFQFDTIYSRFKQPGCLCHGHNLSKGKNSHWFSPTVSGHRL